MRHEVGAPTISPSLTGAQASAMGRQLSDLRILWGVIDAYYPHLHPDDAEPIIKRLTFHLDQLHAAFPNIHDVRGKHIVDIACGSRGYEDDTLRRYEPWMSRLLLSLGAIPVGVDLAPQQGEAFTCHQADLTEPDALKILESGAFDAAYVCAFPTRKAIWKLHGMGLAWPAMRENILAHLKRSLKPGGIIIRQFTDADEDLVRRALLPEPTPIQAPPKESLPPQNLPPSFYFDDDEYLL